MRVRFHVLDPKVKSNLRSYVFQCLLAATTLLVILSIGDVIDRAVMIAAIASTTFVLFIMPHSNTARPRHVVGGHFIALLVGTIASTFDTDKTVLFAVEGALAVGIALFLMAATDTEHAPAAGTVLAVVISGFSWSLVSLLGASVLFLVLTHWLLKTHLRDLY